MVLSWDKDSVNRFPASKDTLPGPGAYDPKLVEGFKADPKSGFLTGQRFGSQEIEGEGHCARLALLAVAVGHADTVLPMRCCPAVGDASASSPPRERKQADRGGDRKFSWATQR